jgi:hypothetical protein
MEFLTEVAGGAFSPNIKAGREVRDLWVHFTNKTRSNDTSSNVAKAFDGLSLSVVEKTAADTVKWMSQVADSLGVERHPSSEKLANKLASALGHPTKAVNSKPVPKPLEHPGS